MKPHLLKIHLTPEHSFCVRYDVVPYFYNKWHFHPEFELVHILKGSGQQFIGDNVHIFKTGDMILLGSNLPHLWRSDEKFFASENSELNVEAIVIHFLPDCFGKDFFSLPENQAIASLLVRSQQGVRIKDETRLGVNELSRELLVAKGTERIVLLLRMLNMIANSKQTKTVCNKGLIFKNDPHESERFNTIYQYILNNYSKTITLQEIAGIAHMSPHSFCRYFKSRIKKTFSRTLMEVRIGNACKLLAETHRSISDICYTCGYNNLSNFNRHFKTITGKTPVEHRKYYQEIRSYV
jgi:AraC-like DNA-binding protein